MTCRLSSEEQRQATKMHDLVPARAHSRDSTPRSVSGDGGGVELASGEAVPGSYEEALDLFTRSQQQRAGDTTGNNRATRPLAVRDGNVTMGVGRVRPRAPLADSKPLNPSQMLRQIDLVIEKAFGGRKPRPKVPMQ